MAKKKAHRTTLRSSSGKKLYAKRNAEGEFTDIQTYKRAHGQDIKRESAAEAAVRAVAHPTPDPNVKLPGVSLPIPVPGSAGSPVTAPIVSKPKTKAKSIVKKAAPKKAAPVRAAVKKVVKAAKAKVAVKKAAPKKAAKKAAPVKKKAKKK